MRRVDGAGEMAAAFTRCRSEAQAAFGDGSVFLEKADPEGAPVEVQCVTGPTSP